MAKSKKDNPTRAALLQAGNIRRSESDVQESGALMGRTRNKEDYNALAIAARRNEFKRAKPLKASSEIPTR